MAAEFRQGRLEGDLRTSQPTCLTESVDHILQTLNNHNQFDTLCRAVLAPIAAAIFRQERLEGNLQSSHMPEILKFKQEVVPHDQ